MKNTNLVEDVEILLPVKFRWIPFSFFRGEVENVSANQRPGRPSCFSDLHEKHKLGRGTEILLLSSFVEFRSAFSEEKSKMSQPIGDQGGHLVFAIGPKNTKLVEDVKILLPVKFRWIPYSGFREEVEIFFRQPEARAGHLVFPIGPKNTNLVEVVEILLPVNSLNSVQRF